MLINNYWRKPLPSHIFGLGNLTRLHLALWRFPDTAGLPPGVAFLSLRELELSEVFINNKDLDFLLSRSRKLEILNCTGNLAPLRLQLVSHSLRCLQIQGSNVEDIAVVDAPRLERLILPGNWAHTHSRVMIEHAPELCIFGTFEPGKHGLQISNTLIKVLSYSISNYAISGNVQMIESLVLSFVFSFNCIGLIILFSFNCIGLIAG